MKRLLQFSLASLILTTLPLSVPSQALANEASAIIIESSEVQVEGKGAFRAKVQVKEIPENTEAVLEFTAWYQAPRISGYYAGLQVFWDGEELLEALDRPPKLPRLKGGESVPSRKNDCWLVAVVPNPAAARDPRSRYTIDPAIVDMVRFRFPLTLQSGTHEVVLSNLKEHDQSGRFAYQVYPTLHLQDIQIRFVSPSATSLTP